MNIFSKVSNPWFAPTVLGDQAYWSIGVDLEIVSFSWFLYDFEFSLVEPCYLICIIVSLDFVEKFRKFDVKIFWLKSVEGKFNLSKIAIKTKT